MFLRASKWLLAGLAGAVLVGGCGSTASTVAPSAAEAGRRDLARCQRIIRAQGTLSRSRRSRFEASCKNARNDPVALGRVAREACIAAVTGSSIPVPVKAALAHCNALE